MLDRIKGCLFGGAIGDALGYAIEFDLEETIFRHYGPDGITDYEYENGVAIISDDTQMTMFTACGLLCADTAVGQDPTAPPPRNFVEQAYLDWLHTQMPHYNAPGLCWLLDITGLHARRAPGNTCLSALSAVADGASHTDYIAANRNNSKGCGGVMRVAPLALHYTGNIEALDMEAAQISAITHGNSLGYMPSAVLVHIINRCVFAPGQLTLEQAVAEALSTVEKLFADDENLPKLKHIVSLAVALSHNTEPDLRNIHRLGEGWVGEEALAIALYCALRHENDFSAAIIAAVNHNGDSDSTGAITGNILGAYLGFHAIDNKWLEGLEHYEVLETLACDIDTCRRLRFDGLTDPKWLAKYHRA